MELQRIYSNYMNKMWALVCARTFEWEKKSFEVCRLRHGNIYQFNAENVVLRKCNVNSLNARPKSHLSVLVADAVCVSLNNYKIECIVYINIHERLKPKRWRWRKRRQSRHYFQFITFSIPSSNATTIDVLLCSIMFELYLKWNVITLPILNGVL